MRGVLNSKSQALLVFGALLLAAFATWAVVRGASLTEQRAEAQATGQPASSFQKSKAGLMDKGLVRQGSDKRYYPTREESDSPTHPDSPTTQAGSVSPAGEGSPPEPP